MSSGKQKSESESYKKEKKSSFMTLMMKEGSPEAKNVEYSKSFE